MWQPVEDAIAATLETKSDRPDLLGQAALDAARRVRAEWMPDAD